MTVTPAPADDGALVIDVIVDDDDRCVRVVVRGDLDIDEVGVFDGGVEWALRQGLPLVVDLRDTTFLGSRGIAAIVRARRLLGDGLGPVTVLVGRDIQRRALEITGVHKLVRIEPLVDGTM